MEKCPYCGFHPFEYVDVGIAMIPVAVNCCEFGYLLYDRGYSPRRIRWYMFRMRLWEYKLRLKRWLTQ